MRSPICQTVNLPAPAEQLFRMYLDPNLHTALTGMDVLIGREFGAKFLAFGGQLSGRMLAVIEPRLIVQSWRSTNFHSDDPDSILILCFSAVGDQGRIDLVHHNVPDQDYEGVANGWEKYYWKPWREYLEKQ